MASRRLQTLLTKWHRMLNLPKQSPPNWYRDRLREELHERRAANTPLSKLSETSDVFFSISRARHDGFAMCKLPNLHVSRHGGVIAYMMAKYTLRWGFYRVAAWICLGKKIEGVREVVNPSKDRKLDEVAGRNGLDKEEFRRVGRRLRCVWPLLP